MTQRPIMDAGPGLNFLSIHKERLLIGTLGPLCVPETVEQEILNNSRRDQRFESAERVWKKLPEQFMLVLSDDFTDALSAAVQRISGQPYQDRITKRRDLGELMVLAHATVTAEAGSDIIVLIDDSDGREAATTEARRLQRMRDSGRAVGQIQLIDTVTVLRRAAGGQHLPTRADLQEVYLRLRGLDDGLLPLKQTDLLDLPCWG